jgi:hypothetical protein
MYVGGVGSFEAGDGEDDEVEAQGVHIVRISLAKVKTVCELE